MKIIRTDVCVKSCFIIFPQVILYIPPPKKKWSSKQLYRLDQLTLGGHLTACRGGGAWVGPNWAWREGLEKKGASPQDKIGPGPSQLQVLVLHLRPATLHEGSYPG